MVKGEHDAFGAQWWEEHYRGGTAGAGGPSSLLTSELADLPVGTVLDAGCGEGADAIWLAEHGWEVTAVDVSATAIVGARASAEGHAPELARRISWLVADLASWEAPQQYDLVLSQYVHPGIPFADFVRRLANAVVAGGTLFIVGHDHADEHSAAHAPENASIGSSAVTSVLGEPEWTIEIAETRTREATHASKQVTMEDVVVKARRAMPS